MLNRIRERVANLLNLNRPQYNYMPLDLIETLVKKRDEVLDYFDEEYRAGITDNAYFYQQTLDFFQNAIDVVSQDSNMLELPADIQREMSARLNQAEDLHTSSLENQPRPENVLERYHAEREDFRKFIDKNKKLEGLEQANNLAKVLNLFSQMNLPPQMARKIDECNEQLVNAKNGVQIAAADRLRDNVTRFDYFKNFFTKRIEGNRNKYQYHLNKAQQAANRLIAVCADISGVLSSYFASWHNESLKNQCKAIADVVNAVVADEVILENRLTPAVSTQTSEAQAVEALQKLKDYKLYSKKDLEQRMILLEAVSEKLNALPQGASALMHDPRFTNVLENRIQEMVEHYSDLSKNQKARLRFVIDDVPLSSRKTDDFKDDIGFWGQVKARWEKFKTIFSSAPSQPAWDKPVVVPTGSSTSSIGKLLEPNAAKKLGVKIEDYLDPAVFTLMDNVSKKMNYYDNNNFGAPVRNPEIVIHGLQNDLDSILSIQKNLEKNKAELIAYFPEQYEKASYLAEQLRNRLETEVYHVNRQIQQEFSPVAKKPVVEIEMTEIKPNKEHKRGHF